MKWNSLQILQTVTHRAPIRHIKPQFRGGKRFIPGTWGLIGVPCPLLIEACSDAHCESEEQATHRCGGVVLAAP